MNRVNDSLRGRTIFEYEEEKKMGVLAQLWIWFDMKYEEKQRKKRGLRASCGFGLLYDSI